MTQLSMAKEGIISDEMKIVAEDESFTPEEIRKQIAAGRIVIPKNIHHAFRPKGIGKGLTTKINANIGTSMDHMNVEEELEKLKVSLAAGADSVMDLSTGGNLMEIRKMMLEHSNVMIGAVPIYAVASDLAAQNKNIFDIAAYTIPLNGKILKFNTPLF